MKNRDLGSQAREFLPACLEEDSGDAPGIHGRGHAKIPELASLKNIPQRVGWLPSPPGGKLMLEWLQTHQSIAQATTNRITVTRIVRTMYNTRQYRRIAGLYLGLVS